jgi:Family of unknown function (DUF6328)
MADQGTARESLSLQDATSHLLNEGRMVLPGIQALFGFQLVVVFNEGFSQRLSHVEQEFHLAATALVAVAVALVMAPAALHRQLQPRAVSDGFVLVSSRLLLWSMLPLAVGVSTDLYLIARVILGATAPAALLAAAVLVVYLALWYGLPRTRGMRRASGLQ